MAALTCGYSAAQTYRPRDFASPQVCSRPAPQRALERRLLAPAVAVALANEQAQESGVDGAREAVASSKRLVRLVKGCSSLWQLQQQLSTTPAPATNSFVLAAALTHAAQLSLKQPLSADEAQWCAALAEQATRPANIARCSPRQVANIAWALTQLGPSNGALLSASGGPQQPVTAAPAAWQVLQQEMHGWLLPPAGQELRAPDSDKRATARDVVMALQACAEAPRPMSEMWVIQALTAVSSSWQSLNAQDCAALATALRLLPHTPSEQWVQEYLQHTLHLLPSAPAEAVCRMVWAMPALIAVQTGSAPQHPRAGQGQLSTWRSALFQVLTEPGWAQHPNVSPYHISALLWGLAQLQWQPPAHVTQGLLARVSVVWEQPHNIAQPATPGTSATAAGFVDSTGHVPDRQGAVSVRRLAAQALNSAALLGCTPPQEWVQGALRYVVNSAAPVTHNTWRDLCAVLTSAVQLRYRPDPPLLTGVLQYACACDTDTITPAQWAQLVWCCAKLGYVPHRHLLAGAVQHAADCFAGAHARGGQRVTQNDLCQLLWSVATLEHIAQSSATAAAATAAQQADSDQPAPAEQALPAPVHSQQPARLVPWSCVGRLVALADAAFATHAIEAEHIAEVVWSLSKLSTRQHSLPHSLRSALMSGVAAAAPQLPSKQLLACCIALPRCGCHRVYDRCKLLRAVLPALLPHWADWGAGTVAHVLTALVDMGYVVPQRKLWLMVPRLLENTRLFKPSRAQALYRSLRALSALGLRAPGQPADNSKADNRHTVWTQLQALSVQALTRYTGSQALSVTQVSDIITLCTGWQWELTDSAWRAFCRRTSHLLRETQRSECVALLFAAARYCSVNEARGIACSGPARWWTKAALLYVFEDLSVLTPQDVAHLLVAMARLGTAASQRGLITTLSVQLEARSALLSKAEHALIRQAWSELSASSSIKAKRAPGATSVSKRTAVTRADTDPRSAQ